MAQKTPNHRRRARKVWPLLVKIARKKRRTTYGEIAGAIGLHHRSARWFLGVIQTECQRLALPPLQSLVVNKKSLRPGKGYTATPNVGSAYEEAVECVHSYRWPKKAPF